MRGYVPRVVWVADVFGVIFCIQLFASKVVMGVTEKRNTPEYV